MATTSGTVNAPEASHGNPVHRGGSASPVSTQWSATRRQDESAHPAPAVAARSVLVAARAPLVGAGKADQLASSDVTLLDGSCEVDSIAAHSYRLRSSGGSCMPNTGKASLLASALGLASNLIGSAMLVMPWTMKESSIVSGAVTMAATSILNGITMVILAKCCEMARSFNYQVIGTRALGKRMGYLIQIIMLFYTFSSCLSYVILIGDLIPNAMHAFRPDTFGITRTTLRIYVILVMGVVVLLPLSFIRNLYSLRYTSALSLTAIMYTVALTLSSLRNHTARLPEIHMFALPICTWNTMAIMNGAFTAHYNVPRFYQELKDRSLPRFAKAVAGAMVSSLLVYGCMAVAGYWRFGDETLGNILNNFSTDDTVALLACITLAIGVSCSFPLCFHAIRASIFTLFTPQLLISANQVFTNMRYVSITVLLVAINLGLGIALKEIETVMIYKGSIFGCGIVYVFPACMFLALRKKAQEKREVRRERRRNKSGGDLSRKQRVIDAMADVDIDVDIDDGSLGRKSTFNPSIKEPMLSANEQLVAAGDIARIESDESEPDPAVIAGEAAEEAEASIALEYDEYAALFAHPPQEDAPEGGDTPDLSPRRGPLSEGSVTSESFALSIDSSLMVRSPSSAAPSFVTLESPVFAVVTWALLVWGFVLGAMGLVINIIVQSGRGLQQCGG